MKKRKQSVKDNKPVTLKQLNQVLKQALKQTVTFKQLKQALKPIEDKFAPIDRKFESIDRKFESIDRRFESIDRKFALQDARLDALEKAVRNLEETVKESFTRMYSHIDAFMKRAESNEHEILFLGRQHDDLAKYCTEKIAYPVYGRN